MHNTCLASTTNNARIQEWFAVRTNKKHQRNTTRNCKVYAKILIIKLQVQEIELIKE